MITEQEKSMTGIDDYWRGKKLRTGSSVKRTIYIVNPASDDRKKDHLVGLMDTPELADQVAARWNAAAGERVTGKSIALSVRGLAAMDNASLTHLVLSLLDEAVSESGAEPGLNAMAHLSVDVIT